MNNQFYYPSICYAAWCGTAENRPKSSSGGVAYALGVWCIKQGGVVYGTAWNSDFNAVIKPAETLAELEAFRGAKYVQSLLSKYTMSQMQDYLDSGRTVLFVGLPCQIAAVKNVLSSYDKLYCVDLLCHGVRPARDFRAEMARILRSKCIKEWTDIRFRGNDAHDFHLSVWDGEMCLYDRPAMLQNYFKAFLTGIGLKEACYSCVFARPERLGDLTLGDFIGLGSLSENAAGTSGSDESCSDSVSSDSCVPSGNVSFIAVNTTRGSELVEALRGLGAKLVERSYEERLSYPYSVKAPFPQPFADKLYRKLVSRIGYASAISVALWWQHRQESFVRFKRKLGIKGSLLFWK